MKISKGRVVLDTNIVLAYTTTKSEDSPNKEIIHRWEKGQFNVLWSRDVLNEYINKMKFFGISEKVIIEIISHFIQFGEAVEIKFYHYEVYPEDAKDICFVLCALNGYGSHIITYDFHLLDLADEYMWKFSITILKPVPFLQELRKLLKET